MIERHVSAVIALVALGIASPPPAAADAVVGTGTPSTCSEAALNAALGCSAPSGSPPRSNCTAGGSIAFNCGPEAVTITVTAQKVIATTMSIDGAGLISLSGGGTTQVLSVNSGADLTLANLTMSNGGAPAHAYVGGAITNHGALNVVNSSFTGNYIGTGGSGGAIFNDGTLTITNSRFSGSSAIAGEGGAIYNDLNATLMVTNSTFSGNSVYDGSVIYGYGNGGAICNLGILTVTGSTFTNNTTGGAYGGAIYNFGRLTVTNSTFAANSAYGGGAIYNDGTLGVTNSTFAGNSAGFTTGGAIHGGATLTNTIVANSTSGGNCSGTITDGGHNLDSDGSCGVGRATDPKLDPVGLANNGGPTQTIALQAGSPAIDAGDETICAAYPVNNLDQRGFGRPGTGATNCSIGAYEYNSTGTPCCPMPTPTATPTRVAVVGAGTADSCSEAALNAALGCSAPSGSPPRSNCTAGGSITFNCGPDAVIMTVTNQKTIAVDMSIDGAGLISLSSGGTTQVLTVNSGATLSLANLSIFTSSNSGAWGAISNNGTLNVTNSTFSGNSGAGSIYNDGRLTVTDSTFGTYGRAIYNDLSSTLTVTNSEFYDIYVGNGGNGGAIYNLGMAVVTDSTFSGNKTGSYGEGDAIFNGGKLAVTKSTFTANSGAGGGVIYNLGALTVTNSTFAANSDRAILNDGALTVTNSTFSGNSGAGAIYNTLTVTLTNTIVADSTSGGNCFGPITDGGHNLDSDGSCGVGRATDPKLDPVGLANNGGPTQTIALQAGSPAIDAGDETICAAYPVNNLDQRGFARPGLGAKNCSIGAYEYRAATRTATPTNTVPASPTNLPTQTRTNRATATATPTNTRTATPKSTPTNTPTRTRTVTPVATVTRKPTPSATKVPTATQTVRPTPTPSPCVGDCDGVNGVTVNEIVTLVNMALGNGGSCANGLPSGVTSPDVSLIITAVNNALNGCPKS